MSRHGQLINGAQRLKVATRELRQKWETTRQEWNDATADEFEERHLAPILPTLRVVLAATSELEELYQKVIREFRDADHGEFER